MAVLVKTNGNVGSDDWGISGDVESLVTQKVSSTQKVEKKEAIKASGEVGAVCYYNKSTEISIEGLGTASKAIAATITTAVVPSAGGTFYCSEVTVDLTNEDFVKSSVKGVAWATM